MTTSIGVVDKLKKKVTEKEKGMVHALTSMPMLMSGATCKMRRHRRLRKQVKTTMLVPAGHTLDIVPDDCLHSI